MNIRTMVGTALILSSLPFSHIAHSAPVISVSACDLAVGTDPSTVFTGATISKVRSGNYNTPSEFFSAVGEPVVVQPYISADEKFPVPSGCHDHIFSGATYKLGALYGRDLTSDSDFEWFDLGDLVWAIKVDFSGGATGITVVGTGFWEQMTVVLYDANGNWISNYSTTSIYEEFAYYSIGSTEPYLGYVHTISNTLLGGPPIATMFVGAWDEVPTWITEISYTPFYVTESRTVGLLLFGLMFLAFSRRQPDSSGFRFR